MEPGSVAPVPSGQYLRGWSMDRTRVIAVDWGTTNRRAYLLDHGGAVLDRMEDDRGVTAIADGDFAGAIAEIAARLGDAPLMLAGMIGSNRGWREAPYLPCPATLADLARGLLWVEAEPASQPVAIVPGVMVNEADRADVMRGEEVQVLGLLQAERRKDALTCHPGTHTKWVSSSGGAITGLRTFMTGELFAILREHSILAPLLQGEVLPDEDFIAGVRAGLAAPPLAEALFSVRARVLLGRLEPACAAARISGLLVGADVAGGLGGAPEVIVLGRPSLNRLYAAALARAGVRSEERDGAEAFVAGMWAIWEMVR
jgi:2-dehydro-3-deoxygalactonokinase